MPGKDIDDDANFMLCDPIRSDPIRSDRSIGPYSYLDIRLTSG